MDSLQALRRFFWASSRLESIEPLITWTTRPRNERLTGHLYLALWFSFLRLVFQVKFAIQYLYNLGRILCQDPSHTDRISSLSGIKDVSCDSFEAVSQIYPKLPE